MVEVLEGLLDPSVVVQVELEFFQGLFLSEVTASSAEVVAVVSLVVPHLNSSS